MKKLIDLVDYEGIRNALSENPVLANKGIPFDEVNTTKAHPLHRICDGVFSGTYTDEEAASMARIFLDYGANVDGYKLEEKADTPLIAAASLHAELTGILYIERGANIHHAGSHGGTALHWAAWCGRDKLVERLIAAHADIDKRCTEFKGTPLLWAVNGYRNGGPKNRHNQLICARILLDAGANKHIPNIEGIFPAGLLDDKDREFMDLLIQD